MLEVTSCGVLLASCVFFWGLLCLALFLWLPAFCCGFVLVLVAGSVQQACGLIVLCGEGRWHVSSCCKVYG